MNGKFSRSFQLVKESFRVLMQDKEILLFPLLAFLLICLTAFIIFHSFDFSSLSKSDIPPPEFIRNIIIVYFLIFFIFTFSNAGVVASTYTRLLGGNPTVTSSLDVITKNFLRIFIWAIFSSTIGVVMLILKDKNKGLMRFFWQIFDIAWSLIALMTLPIIVLENTTIKEGVQKVGIILKKTWGENLIGQFSMELFFSVIWVATGFIFFIIIAPLLPSSLLMPSFIFTVALFIFYCLLLTTLRNIYASALYFYAITGQIPSQYGVDSIKGAFIKKEYI